MKTLLIIIFTVLTSIVNGQTCTVTYSVTQTGETCTGCCDGSISVTNIQNGCAPFWITLYPGPQTSGSGVFTNLCSQVYTVTVQDGGCCGPASYSVCVDFTCNPTGIKEYTDAIKVVINYDQIILTNYFKNSLLKIYDLTGSLVKTIENVNGAADISSLSNGVYLLFIYSDDKLEWREKILKH